MKAKLLIFVHKQGRGLESTKAPDPPVICVYDKEKELFRVVHSHRAKLSTGGWGIPIPEVHQEGDQKKIDCKNNSDDSNDVPADSSIQEYKVAPEYLFAEQVVFLHERGMLRAHYNDENSKEMTKLELYKQLELQNVSLAAYLVYAHLCKQSYRVLRHSTHRYEILVDESASKSDVKTRLRADMIKATLPRLGDQSLSIWWDVYMPSSEFKRSDPGFPDFYVAGTFIHGTKVTYQQILDLQNKLQDQQQGRKTIPLKIANVSDSGTVLMFGIHPIGAPMLSTKVTSDIDRQDESQE